jgi:hypothetical protein
VEKDCYMPPQQTAAFLDIPAAAIPRAPKRFGELIYDYLVTAPRERRQRFRHLILSEPSMALRLAAGYGLVYLSRTSGVRLGRPAAPRDVPPPEPSSFETLLRQNGFTLLADRVAARRTGSEHVLRAHGLIR